MNLTGPALDLRPRYNVAPGQNVAAVRSGDGDGDRDGDRDCDRQLSMLRWGLIPVWSKKPNIGYSLINARSETVAFEAGVPGRLPRQAMPDSRRRFLRVGPPGKREAAVPHRPEGRRG